MLLTCGNTNPFLLAVLLATQNAIARAARDIHPGTLGLKQQEHAVRNVSTICQ
jgi:hypothetical protein